MANGEASVTPVSWTTYATKSADKITEKAEEFHRFGAAGSLIGIPGHQGTSTGGLRTEHSPAPCPEWRSSPRYATDDHGTNTRADASHSSSYWTEDIRGGLSQATRSLMRAGRPGGGAKS
jgi:hypothetical protein